MHYAVPRILHRSLALERLYTDFYAPDFIRGVSRLTSLPDPIKRGLGRFAADLPSDHVKTFPGFGVAYALKRRNSSQDAIGDVFLWAGRKFGERAIAQRLRWGDGVYCFNSAALEILVCAREAGKFTALEQTIAPLAVETDLIRQEREMFPEWERPESSRCMKSTAERCNREREEWGLANLILCGSSFVRDSIHGLGGPISKCVVVPYGVDLQPAAIPKRRDAGPLKVLVVGAVGLRKGSPYVLEVARRLGSAASIRMVGAISASEKALRSVPSNVRLVGAVPRHQIGEHYAWADVFVLPSLCEGSATATYEALAWGLPVICTPNTGSTITDGKSGSIVPIRDVERIIASLEQFIGHNNLLTEMSLEALNAASDISVERYGDRLIAALGGAGA